jgi:hypothetical protein
MMQESIWIGFDPREADAFAVCRHTIRRHLTRPIPVRGLVLSQLQRDRLYKRPIEYRQSAADRPVMWDPISDAAMSTEHANARFLVPHLARTGWALFCDGDILVRGNLARLLDGLDRRFAAYCVKHVHAPNSAIKMDGQIQTVYARKNWTSFIVWNCDHPAMRRLTVDMVNTLPGRDLHRLCWLDDSEIGELDPRFNFLVGHNDPAIEPVVVHFTEGTPAMPGYEHVPFADEWRAAREHWAS